MKFKKILSLLLCLAMTFSALSFSAVASGTTPTFNSGSTSLSVTVQDADILKYEQNGTSADVTIFLSNVTNNKFNISVTSNPKVAMYSSSVTLDDGTAIVKVQLKPSPAANAPVVAQWNITFVDSGASGNVEKPASIKMTSNLSESEVKYVKDKPASALTVKADHSEGEKVTYQWYSNSAKSTSGAKPIEGEVDESFTPSTEYVGTTYYYAVATGGELSVTSKIAKITVEAPTLGFSKNLDEAEIVCTVGKKAPTLSVNAEFSGVSDSEITYDWYKNTEKTTDGGVLIDGTVTNELVPSTDTAGTSYYYVIANLDEYSATSKIATVTVEEEIKLDGGLWIGKETSQGTLNFVNFTDEAENKIEGLTASLEGGNLNVILPHSYGADGKIIAIFNLTQNGDLPFITTKTGTTGTSSGKAVNNKFTEKTLSLKNGSAVFTFYLYDSVPTNRNNNYETYVLNISLENNVPTLTEGQKEQDAVEIVSGSAFSLDLSDVFSDADGDELTYFVNIDGKETEADQNFSFSPTVGGTYTLTFSARDFMCASEESYTVNLTVKNSDVTYDTAVLVPEDVTPSFYITDGYDESGAYIVGEELNAVKGETADGFTLYTVSVPENISAISVGDELGRGMSFDASAESTTKLQNVQANIVDFGEKEISGTVSVSIDGHKAKGTSGIFLLVSDKLYSFSALPENSSVYNTKSENITLTQDVSAVTLKVTYKNPKTITTTTGARAEIFKYASNYFVHTPYEPLSSIDNRDGTTTHYFAVDGDLSYRVSMDGKITKAGYLSRTNSVTVLHTDSDKLPTDRIDYYTATSDASTVGDDSVLVNINQRNHLSLNIGDSKTIKGYRAWEIINNYLNHIIMPDFNFAIISGEDVVSLERIPGQPTTNGSGNQRKLTAIGKGTAIVEVTYDAIEISGGSYEGFYGATDKSRTGLFVVTVGESVPEVDFGIDCKTSAGSIIYKETNAKNWDAELDTLYFLGESGEIRLSPTSADANILEVSVSNDKGQSFTTLENTDGVYTAPIVSSNNIIRVTTDNGTAYQIVRGDKAELIVKNVSCPGNPIEKGDTISVRLEGLHTPVPKISGTYNPGYSGNTDGESKVHIRYSFGQESLASEGVQYDFSRNGTTLEFTLPADGDETDFTLTDGYIGVGVIGVEGFSDDGNSHRNIPDNGGGTRDSKTTFTTRSILPDITVSVGMLPSGNTAPFIRENAPETVSLTLGKTYAVSMSKVFSDRDGDKLTYFAKIGEGERWEIEDGYFTFTPDEVGTYTIEFTANDGSVDSVIHTLTLTVKEKDESPGPSPDYDTDNKDGYVKISFEDNGKRVEGEENVTYPKPLGTIISQKKVPFEKGDTVADVTLRLLDALGYSYEHSGTTKEGFYLASIGGFSHKGIDYDSFGEFDAGAGSGWMITLNGMFIERGASDFEVENGDVIKWQYTCQLGKDIGNTYWDNDEPVITPDDKDKKENTSIDDLSGKNNKDETLVFSENTFSDVSEDDWYYDSVKYVYEKGLMNGTDSGFEPECEVTRAMAVTVLYRLENEPAFESVALLFSDIPENEWYTDAVMWAKANGIVKGITENEFAPDDSITREQLASIICRYANFKGYNTDSNASLTQFTDKNKISGFAREGVKWAYVNGLIKGIDSKTLSPEGTATRAQFAAILMRFCTMELDK